MLLLPLLLLLGAVMDEDGKFVMLHSGNRCSKISLNKVPNANGTNKSLIIDEFKLKFNLTNNEIIKNGSNWMINVAKIELYLFDHINIECFK